MAGFGNYLRFILRRERVIGAVWIVSIVLFSYAIAVYYPSLFPSEAEVASMTEMLKNPAMVGMMGPVYGGDLPSVAMLFSQEMSIWVMLTIAVMNIFFVNRHTRADEELGRLEMFRALPVGRLTGASSTLFGAIALNVVIAIFTALLLAVSGMSGADFAGSLAYSSAVFGVGLFFAAVTLLFAQLFGTSRGVTGAAFAVLGLTYMLRAVGDIQGGTLAFISPLGLGLRVFAFYENNFWCVAVLIAESVAVAIAAFAVLAIRDHGTGIIPAKKGRANASQFLRSPLGLAWRLTKNSALIWCGVVFIVGAMYGSMFGDIENFVQNNEYYQHIITGGADVQGSMLNSFAAFLFVIMALIAVIPIISTANKIHAEEKRGRLEPALVRSVSRAKMYGAYIIIGAVESVALQICAALGVYSPSGGLVDLGDMLTAALAYIPAMLVMMSIVIFLVGAMPKMIAFVWVVFGYAAFSSIFSRIFDLPDWMAKLSPFGNVPQLPVAEFDAVPLVALTIIAIVLTAVGVWRFNERDLV
ncbi:ABC transporter permease [Clostridia bacterium]|nr:ABC transporter permease [Clostridia bacterium]